MPNNPCGPIRRAQLVTPFGVGAMVTVPGGTSLLIAGLDYWFKKHDGSDISDPEEFIFEEWRLQELLGINQFRLPPDFRAFYKYGNENKNSEITIPAFRFPAWHFCPDCKLLKEWPMYKRGKVGRIKCPECDSKKKTRYMFQVPFIAMCEQGHLQDFPWREWVHHEVDPLCDGELRLISTGSATLAGQKVRCDKCGNERNLEGITRSFTSSDGKTTTTLSKTLSSKKEFPCKGQKPWLGPEIFELCDAHLKGSLKSASNVYFAQLRSSIFLPRLEDNALQELEILLGDFPLSTFIKMLKDLDVDNITISGKVRTQYPRLLSNYSSEQIVNVLDVTLATNPNLANNQYSIQLPDSRDDEQTLFRRSEYDGLRKERNDVLLKIKAGNLKDYTTEITKYFSRIMLIEKLQETRTLTGFTRIFPENNLSILQRQQLLWKSIIGGNNSSWLPANKVFGEGIFFDLNEEKLKAWECLTEVNNRAQPLLDRYHELQTDRKLRDRQIGPRFILAHTFAHLIMNRLSFDCGYGSAALRERLYISSDPNAPMAGLLIYTADGDSEGTMGGLVRMGKPGNIEPVVMKAIENAKWCSSDPVCMEMGDLHGQGPDSCNLAACHNCALVPETACEEFNRFLDRGLVVGTIENPNIGYFDL